MNKMSQIFKSGFVGILGRPNVGKSTLLNTLVQKKLAIVSDKPQTTRHRIRCVVNRPDAQIIFIDTPGFHKPKDALGKHLNKAVRKTMKEVDVILFVVDAFKGIGKGDHFIAAELKKIFTPCILLLNKIDLVRQNKLNEQMKLAKELNNFKVFPISALKGINIDVLIDNLVELLPEGPKYYPEDMITDQPERLIAAEFIRETVVNLTYEEIPYSVAVDVEEISKREGKELVDIYATIYVERDSQKGIIIGEKGKLLKEIGKQARLNIQNLLGSQVNLQSHVKVRKKWRRDERAFSEFGLIE